MKPESQSLARKAQRSLRAAKRLFGADDYDFAASRAYYAMFYVAEALLLERGASFSKHAGVIAGVYTYYVKPGLISKRLHQALHRAFEARQQGDYGFDVPFPQERARELISDAEEFLRETQSLLKSKGGKIS